MRTGRVSSEHSSEERAAGGEDNSVTPNLAVILTGKGHVAELFVLVKIADGRAGILIKFLPTHLQCLHCVHCVLANDSKLMPEP